MVREENGKYCVYSKSGEKLSSHCFDTEEEANKRLQQIEYFKQMNDSDTYDESGILLDSPFLNNEGSFSVNSKNSQDDTVLVKFSGVPVSVSSKDPSTPNYWNELIAGSKLTGFKHSVFFDSESRTIRSVRDGVQEYLGIEIGVEPYDKVFTIYRSPETISAIVGKLNSLPITNDHVAVDSVDEVKRGDILGMLTSSTIIELEDEATASTLGIENKTALDDRAIALSNSGKKEFSLGYNGRLRLHDKYDFEQYDFEPTHLALVDSARGGSILTFVDKKVTNMGNKTLLKVFLDAEGNPNLQQIVEIAQELPEALKKVPVDKLQEMLPMLQEIVSMAGGVSGEPEMPEEAVMTDEAMEDMDEEDQKKFGDSKLYKSVVAANSKTFADSKAFKDAVTKATKEHAVVIQKAVDFVDEQYSFADKSTKEIMRDALKSEFGESVEFEDSELSTAFKMLKKSDSSLKNFGDGKTVSALEARIEKELEAE